MAARSSSCYPVECKCWRSNRDGIRRSRPTFSQSTRKHSAQGSYTNRAPRQRRLHSPSSVEMYPPKGRRSFRRARCMIRCRCIPQSVQIPSMHSQQHCCTTQSLQCCIVSRWFECCTTLPLLPASDSEDEVRSAWKGHCRKSCGAKRELTRS